MAYDYYAKTITSDVMESGFTTTPVTPFDEVYYALKVITDENTGVADKSKVVLGLSMSCLLYTSKTDEIVKLLDEHKNGKNDNSRKIWAIYMFLVWHKKFFEDELKAA